MRRCIFVLGGVGAVIVAAGCRLVQGPPPPPPADNELCLVCHFDFSTELITTSHALKGIGCTSCHGPSEAHMANEENVIAPDVMYEKADVARTCHVCHGPMPEEHPAIDLTVVTPEGICTECHGSHRVADPRRRWDKKTRELL